MSWGLVIAGVGAAVGGAMSADAAGDAADGQVDAANNATALQKYIYDDQKAMHAPWLQAGGAGLNKLSYLLGLSPTGFGGGAAGSMPTMETPEQIRARLLQKFTTQTATGQVYVPGSDAEGGQGGYQTMGGQSQVNEAGLAKAIAAEQAKQKAAYEQAIGKAEGVAGRDPEYGSLLDKFGMKDFKADPGYAFRQSEGEKALQRQLSAGGKFYSGEAMKDMARFSQGLASQEYGAAFDRFNVGNTNTFNRLAAISGVGQTAANQTGAAGQNYANQAGNNMMGAANASAAGTVGSANAWNGAISQGISGYQQNQLLKSLQPQTPSYYGGNGGGAGNYNYGGGY